MSVLRLFVAIEILPSLLTHLTSLARDLSNKPGGNAVRWVEPTGIHLTLQFLGDVDSTKVPQLSTILTKTCTKHKSFTLSVGGVGCFPNVRRPRVVWVGIQDAQQQLAKLQQDTQTALLSLGLALDDRTFTPHLTLGRVQQAASLQEISALGQEVSRYPRQSLPDLPVYEVALVRSVLRPGGAEYTLLHAAPLKADD